MNVFSLVQWNKYFHSVKGQMFYDTFHLSPHENNCTIALINIHYSKFGWFIAKCKS